MESFKNFFSQADTREITKKLLGALLVYKNSKGEILSGYITEAEAYLGENDSTAHAFKGKRTPSNEPLYGLPSNIYIYTIHSQYMLDFSAQKKGVPHGILIRGIEPFQGKKIMEQNRLKHGVNLTNGPGKLMQALGIQDKKMNTELLGQGALTIDFSKQKIPKKIIATPRIGVSNQGSWAQRPYRYYVAHNPYVSKQLKRNWDLKTNGWQEERVN